jgi:hypothetical protein
MKGVGFVREREGLGSASSRSSYPFLYSLVFFEKKKRRIRDLVRVFIFTFYSFFFSFIESEKVGSDLITNYPYVLIDTWRFSVGMDLTVKWFSAPPPPPPPPEFGEWGKNLVGPSQIQVDAPCHAMPRLHEAFHLWLQPSFLGFHLAFIFCLTYRLI